ncbi:MAG: DoxX family protein [Cypionkella sp.]
MMDTPVWVRVILESKASHLVARILLTAAFWTSGLMKLADFNGTVAETAQFGLPMPVLVAAATIVVQLAGSALVIANRLTWLGAGALGVFTFLAALVADPFWSATAPPHAFATFTEHLGIIAGFVLVSILSLRKS